MSAKQKRFSNILNFQCNAKILRNCTWWNLWCTFEFDLKCTKTLYIFLNLKKYELLTYRLSIYTLFYIAIFLHLFEFTTTWTTICLIYEWANVCNTKRTAFPIPARSWIAKCVVGIHIQCEILLKFPACSLVHCTLHSPFAKVWQCSQALWPSNFPIQLESIRVEPM